VPSSISHAVFGGNGNHNHNNNDNYATLCRCTIDREHARELSLLKPTLDNYGVHMIAVGRGSVGMKKWVKGGYWHGDTYVRLLLFVFHSF
jgi:hypothetical protein